jgi:hypothetical protein
LVYLKGAEIDNLKEIFRATDSIINCNTALYEEQFNAQPFKIFSNTNKFIIRAADQGSIVE